MSSLTEQGLPRAGHCSFSVRSDSGHSGDIGVMAANVPWRGAGGGGRVCVCEIHFHTIFKWAAGNKPPGFLYWVDMCCFQGPGLWEPPVLLGWADERRS